LFAGNRAFYAAADPSRPVFKGALRRMITFAQSRSRGELPDISLG
jgi:hypothetical protein